METKLLLAATTGIAIFCYNLAKKSYLKGFDAGYDTGKDRALKSDMTDEEFIKYRLSLLS